MNTLCELEHDLHAQKLVFLQICEDVPEELDVDVPGLPERPINVFMPRLLQVCVTSITIKHGVCTFISTICKIINSICLCAPSECLFSSQHASVEVYTCLHTLVNMFAAFVLTVCSIDFSVFPINTCNP